MYPFRTKTPVYTKNRRVCKHYKSYKKTLRKDFNLRCGYCNDADIDRIRDYVIDHFVPRKPNGWSHNIQPNYYYNLIYSCRFCNGAKLNTWPTKKSNKYNDGKVGFIKPTNRNYGKLFKRDQNGNIIYNKSNSIADFIYEELNLWEPIHSLNWLIEKHTEQISVLEKLNIVKNHPTLSKKIMSLKASRDELTQSIKSQYNV